MLYANAQYIDDYRFPIWLKEGDVLEIEYTYTQGTAAYHISGIEFNIVTD